MSWESTKSMLRARRQWLVEALLRPGVPSPTCASGPSVSQNIYQSYTETHTCGSVGMQHTLRRSGPQHGFPTKNNEIWRR